MKIRRFEKVAEENGFVASYTHMGGKIVVLIDVETDVVNDAIREMARTSPCRLQLCVRSYTSRAEVDRDFIEKEKGGSHGCREE